MYLLIRLQNSVNITPYGPEISRGSENVRKSVELKGCHFYLWCRRIQTSAENTKVIMSFLFNFLERGLGGYGV